MYMTGGLEDVAALIDVKGGVVEAVEYGLSWEQIEDDIGIKVPLRIREAFEQVGIGLRAAEQITVWCGAEG